MVIPIGFFPHITNEDVRLLTNDELDMLLYIVNITFPISPPFASEENKYPITVDLLKAINRNSVVDRIKKSEPMIKDEGKEIYNGLKTKLGVT